MRLEVLSLAWLVACRSLSMVIFQHIAFFATLWEQGEREIDPNLSNSRRTMNKAYVSQNRIIIRKSLGIWQIGFETHVSKID
jgi:hypothetical protein